MKMIQKHYAILKAEFDKLSTFLEAKKKEYKTGGHPEEKYIWDMYHYLNLHFEIDFDTLFKRYKDTHLTTALKKYFTEKIHLKIMSEIEGFNHNIDAYPVVDQKSYMKQLSKEIYSPDVWLIECGDKTYHVPEWLYKEAE